MFKKTFDEICRKYFLASASMAVYNKGTIEEFNYGYRNLKTFEKVNSNSIYRIASISKMIIAICIMKLYEEKKLNLNEDVSKYLGFKLRNPSFPSIPITLKMIMTQTSSLSDGDVNDNKKGYNGVNGESFSVSLKKMLTDDKYEYYSSLSFSQNKPGEVFEYSNLGAGVLAMVVEKTSKMYFTDYVEENVLKPLNMDASFRPSHLQHPERIVNLYRFDDESQSLKEERTAVSFIKSEYPLYSKGDNFRGPAGGLFSSSLDLVKIMNVLMHDGKYEDVRILQKETVDEMLEMSWAGLCDDYKAKALQMKISDDAFPLVMKGHTGSAYGLRSFLFFNKEEDLGFVFLSGGGNFKEDIVKEMMEKARDYFFTNASKKTLSIDLRNNLIVLNDRKITCNDRKIDDNEISLPLYSLCEGLTIVPSFEDDYIVLRKNSKEMKYSKELKLFPLIKTAKRFGYETVVRNGIIVVEYE